MKSKYKSLLKNIGLLTISNFGSKILVLFLIPLYTSILSTKEYGMFDLYSTTLSLLAPILTLNIVHAVMRFCMDKKYDNNEVVLVGIKKELIAQLIFIIIVLLNWELNLIPIFAVYPTFLILLFLSQRIYTFLSQLSRGLDKVFVLAIGGIINSISMLLLNVIFLLLLNLKLEGFFIANILSYFIPSIIMIIFLKLHKIKYKKVSKNVKTEMVKYSTPMIFSTIGWWINNVSDRYIVTWLCGLATNGIYSVAYKIPSMLNIVQNIFNQAWVISATKEYDKNSDEFYTKTYKIYNVLMVIICSILIIFNKVIAIFLFSKDFYSAWKYAPFLMISALFTGIFGYLEGIFVAAKNTKIIAISTCIGAIINIVLNIVLINFIGSIGAAISTMISSTVIWIVRIIKVKKMIIFNINIKNDIISYILLIVQSALFFINMNIAVIIFLEIIIFIIIIILNKYEINKLFVIINKLLNKNKSQKKLEYID